MEYKNTEHLPVSLSRIVEKLSEKNSYLPSEVVKIVKEAKVVYDDLLPWADFNHPVTDSYGRKTVYSSPYFEIMVMSWVTGDISAIHDHGYTMWGAVQIFGENEHAVFKKDDGVVKMVSRGVFSYGQVVGVAHDLIHQMGNFSGENVLSLHIYGSEKPLNNVTGDTRLYNVALGRLEIINGGVFYDLKEDNIERVIEGVRADLPTLLRDKVELANRIKRINPNDKRLFEIREMLLSDEVRQEILSFKETANQREVELLNKELKAVELFLSQQKSLVV